MMKKNKREVVVTGLGVVSPMDCGAGIDSFWEGLCQGRNAIKPLRLIEAKENFCQVGGEAFDFERFLKNRPKESTGRCADLFQHALRQAIDDANGARVISKAGIAFGTILGEVTLGQRYIQKLMEEKKKDTLLLQNYSLHSVPTHFARELQLTGPCLCVNTTCSSSGDAIGLALREIEHERADIMVAGGSDRMSEVLAAAFASTEAVSKDGIIRPFDKNRKGFCISEGAGVVILEELNHAKKRGAKIYGKISGYGSTTDANHLYRPDEDGEGLARAIDMAIDDAGWNPGDVDYINAHGMATMYSDLSETRAIKKSFKHHAKSVKISSIKSMIGHTMGACSVLDFICCVKILCHGVIPPTINYETADPECDLDYVPNVAIFQKIHRALSLSAGLGGQNCAITVEGYDDGQ